MEVNPIRTQPIAAPQTKTPAQPAKVESSNGDTFSPTASGGAAGTDSVEALPKPPAGPPGPAGDATFSYNPKDVDTMPAETVVVHGLKGGKTVETDKIRLSTRLDAVDGGYVFDGKGSEANFTAANAFAAAADTKSLLDQHFGAVADSTGHAQLTVNADKGQDFNAYFQPGDDSINFFHGTDPVTKTNVKSGDAGDVVGHEYGHKDLNDRRPAYFNSWAPDPGAFHESYGDVVAFLSATQKDSVIKKMVEQTAGDLSKNNVASESAVQLGTAINHVVGHDVTGGNYIRNANNNFKWADPSTLEDNPKDPNQLGSEVHNFSRLWTGAFYDVFEGLTAENIKAGQDPATAIKNASNEGFAMYGRLFGKNGTAPEGEFTYKDMANAWIKGEQEQGGAHAELVRSVMIDRQILTKTKGFDDGVETLPAGTREFTSQLGQDVPDAFKGAVISTTLSGEATRSLDGDDPQAHAQLQAQVTRAIKNGDVLIRAEGATGTPSADELRKPSGGFYKGYLDTVDGQKTVVRAKIAD